MPPRADQQPNSSGVPLLRRTDQSALAVTVVLCLAAMGYYWFDQGGLQGRIIDIDRAEPLEAAFQVDVNQAPWFEFAQIPDVGETIGRRIVLERQVNGPFLDHFNMQQRVRGIGPKTLENMQPYLLPMPRADTIVDESPGDLPNG